MPTHPTERKREIMVKKKQEKKREEDWQYSAIGCATDRCGIVHESALLPKGEGSALY